MAFGHEWRVPGLLLSASLVGISLTPNGAVARPAGEGCIGAPVSPLVVRATDMGATADDDSDDTAAIQAAIDAVAGTGGTVHVPDGTYLVDAAGPQRLRLKSHMRLSLAPAAVLKALPNSADRYAVLSISGVSDVTVVGGTLEGEREAHRGTSGEWGMGIRIDGGSERITVSGVTSRKMWGDGFYVHGASGVLLCAIVADNNRRQGLSVIEVDGLVVTNSVFKSTHGTRPASGIDLEPDLAAEAIANVRIEGSQFLDNAGAGLLIDGGKGPVSNVEIVNNVFAGNARSIKIKHAPEVAARCGNEIVSQSSAWSDLSALVELATYAVAGDDCDE